MNCTFSFAFTRVHCHCVKKKSVGVVMVIEIIIFFLGVILTTSVVHAFEICTINTQAVLLLTVVAVQNVELVEPAVVTGLITLVPHFLEPEAPEIRFCCFPQRVVFDGCDDLFRCAHRSCTRLRDDGRIGKHGLHVFSLPMGRPA